MNGTHYQSTHSPGAGRAAYARTAAVVLWRAFGLGVFLSGAGLAIYAVVQWLQTAHWQPLTVNGLLTSWTATRDWVFHPRTWLGLHRVIMSARTVPLFVIVMLLGGALLVFSTPRWPVSTWRDRW